jgi:hypothetical protein
MIKCWKKFLFLINLLIYVNSYPLDQQEDSSFIPCGMPPEIQMV